MSLEKAIGIELRKHRQSKDMSLTDVTNIIGMTNGGLSMIETNKRGLSFDTFLDICNALGVKPSTITKRAEKLI